MRLPLDFIWENPNDTLGNFRYAEPQFKNFVINAYSKHSPILFYYTDRELKETEKMCKEKLKRSCIVFVTLQNLDFNKEINK